MTRQQKYQRDNLAKGLCRQCPNPREPDDPQLCAECRLKKREARRIEEGCEPWREGGPGRPPKITVEG